MEFLRLMRETQGLSITLRVRHAEVGVHILLNGAALAVADYRHRCAVEVANAAEDGMVVRKIAVAVQLGEVGEQLIDIVREHRTLGIVNDTHFFTCGFVNHDATPAISWTWSRSAASRVFPAFL